MSLPIGKSRALHHGIDPDCTIAIEHQDPTGAQGWQTTYTVRAAKQPSKPFQIGPSGLPILTTFWVEKDVQPAVGDNIHILQIDDLAGVDTARNYEIVRVDSIGGDYYRYTEFDVKGYIR